ncbi:hypothetical protein [Lysobacter silvisoli]|uniref:Nitroreductase domain-containing protein n=1 Tax=Lysobacter silvisoli TaxID=2293254 RepID=A0A371K3X6_9GAMM|nr:hypothetical protein [Lysobacter silvisoli]RDZ28625.1 hypothetical protein DX914_05730 [Lysobacter silvisoli]
MTAPDPARADQLEAWLLSGHQRLERLIVPAFAEGKKALRRQASAVEPASLRLLPSAGLPRELCDLDAWLSGSRAGMPALDEPVRWSLFFRYLAAPLRYEPYSESAIHKAVPSSRGRYPLKYYLLRSRGGTTQVHAYVPEFHGLQALPPLAAGAMGEGTAALVCVGRAWRYAEEYGEFAHVPCVLEAGHAQAQAQHLAQLLGIDETADPDRETGRPLCSQPFEIPLYAIGLRPGFEPEDLPAEHPRLSAPRPYPEMEQRFPRLRLFQRSFDRGATPARVAASAVPGLSAARRGDVGGRGVLGVMRRRSSGNDRGLASSVLTQVPAGTCASVIATWSAIRRRRPSSAAAAELAHSLLWLGQEPGRPPGVLDIDADAPAPQAWRGDLREAVVRMLPYANTKYNFATLTAVLIVQADVRAAMERLGDAALREIHLAAGATAQDFSLAAAAHDLYARPTKMMREARLESELALRGQAVYLVLCGHSRSANPTMELC